MYIGDDIVGTIRKEFKLLRPTYNIDCNGWKITGNFFEFDYEITNPNGSTVAAISKQLLNFTDTYVIDVNNKLLPYCFWNVRVVSNVDNKLSVNKAKSNGHVDGCIGLYNSEVAYTRAKQIYGEQIPEYFKI
jgi:hypothetical protein